MVEQWAEFDGECPVTMIIPCRSRVNIRHQYNGLMCSQFVIEGIQVPFPMPLHLVRIWGYDVMDYCYPDERQAEVSAIALQLSEYFRVPIESIEVLGEALVRVGNFYLAQENSD